jgi:hypothetical protein
VNVHRPQQAGPQTRDELMIPCLSAQQAMDTEMGKFDFCVSRQIQQLGQCINVRFTVHDDQALQAIPRILRYRHTCLYRWLFSLVFLHALRPRQTDNYKIAL